LIAGPLTALGESLLERRQWIEAGAALQRAREVLAKQQPTIQWLRADVSSLLGAALAGQEKYAEAEPLLVSGYEGLRDVPGSPRTRLRKSLERLVAFYTTSGRTAEVAPWRARLHALAPGR
jgi:eukaryotic-like serine/threonine-protein kinase